jgi:D-3-phosphoglycerate dehydrogenase
MLKIAITTTSFGEENKAPIELLKKKGFGIIMNPYGRKLTGDEVSELCRDVAGIIAGTEKLDAVTLERLINLKVISRCGAGLDNIDIDAAKKMRIKIYNTPDAPAQAVAELTVGLVLNLLRKVNQANYALKGGKWEKMMGNLLCGKHIGIIGFGRIGKKVAELLKAFGCELAYYDPYVKKGLMGLSKMSLKELLQWAEIVCIHVSTKDKLLGMRELRLMRKGALLVNVSRGGIVDEEALYVVLREGYLFGAALDVFEKEPYKGKLIELDNALLTPHIGSYAREARIEMERQAVNNLLEGLEVIK